MPRPGNVVGQGQVMQAAPAMGNVQPTGDRRGAAHGGTLVKKTTVRMVNNSG